jgi:excisionase family DNA binding protein
MAAKKPRGTLPMERRARKPEAPESRRKDIAAELSPGDQSKVMTIAEVADYLNCHYGTVYRLVRGGELPAFRLGGSWRFLRSDLEQWIAGRTSGASVEKERESEPPGRKVQDRVRRPKRKPKSKR